MAIAGFNHFPAIAAALKPACQRAIHETAGQIQGWAKSEAAYRTGFMQENIYVSDMDGSDYGLGGTSPPGDSYLLPEVTPDDDMTAIVGCAANYSGFVELGTRFMPAQPFFYAAVQIGQSFFDAELAKIAPELEGIIV